MKYIRQKTFTLSAILFQLAEYLKKYRKYPKAIYLPPEERVFINYMFSTEELKRKIKTFHGIPLKIYYDKQELPFGY